MVNAPDTSVGPALRPGDLRTWNSTSASQIKEARYCLSSWWQTTILGQRAPGDPSTWVGTLLHLFAEGYLVSGLAPATSAAMFLRAFHAGPDAFSAFMGAHREAQEIKAYIFSADAGIVRKQVERAAKALASGVHRLPAPGHPRDLLEKSVFVPLADRLPPAKGFIDLIERPVLTGDREGRPVIFVRAADHKSTSDVSKWALSQEQLWSDPQALIYSLAVLVELGRGLFAAELADWGFTAHAPWTPGRAPGVYNVFGTNALIIGFRLIYYQTTHPKTHEVEVFYRPQDLLRGIEELAANDLAPMQRAALATRLEDVPHNLNACGRFRGCYHRAACARIGRKTMPLSGLLTAAIPYTKGDQQVPTATQIIAMGRVAPGEASAPQTLPPGWIFHEGAYYQSAPADPAAVNGWVRREGPPNPTPAAGPATNPGGWDGHNPAGGMSPNPADGTPPRQVVPPDPTAKIKDARKPVVPAWPGLEKWAGKDPKQFDKAELRGAVNPAIAAALAARGVVVSDPFAGREKAPTVVELRHECFRLVAMTIEWDAAHLTGASRTAGQDATVPGTGHGLAGAPYGGQTDAGSAPNAGPSTAWNGDNGRTLTCPACACAIRVEIGRA